MVDPAHSGKEYPPFSFTIDRSKLREFLAATNDDNPVYEQDDPPLPLTFATLFRFWGGGGLEGALNAIDVEVWNVLHGEQEYEYLAPVHLGDTVTGVTRITNIYNKAGMDFVQFETEYRNQHDQPVVVDRALIIVR